MINFFRFSALAFVLLCNCINPALASGDLDTLYRQMHTGNDSLRLKARLELAGYYSGLQLYDSALLHNEATIRLLKETGNEKLLPGVYAARGKMLCDMGNYQAAIRIYEMALRLYEKQRDLKQEANVYNLIANAWHLSGDYPAALKNQYAALKIRESIRDEEGIAWSYNNIGMIYRIQGDYPAALKNYFASMHLLEKIGDLPMVAMAHNNIGNIYSLQGKYTHALDSYIESLKIRKQAGSKKDILASYFNIGDIFCDLFEKDSVTHSVRVTFPQEHTKELRREQWLATALEIHSQAAAMNRETGDAYLEIYSLSGRGRVYFLQQNYRESIRLYSEAYNIADKLDEVELQVEIAKYLADNYDRLKDFRNGMYWYMQYSAHKDSLENKLKSDELTKTRLRFEFEKKESEAKAQQDKKDALAKAELDRQKKMRNIFVGGFALVFCFAGIFFYQRNHIRREKGRSDDLLLNILPSEIANELKQTGASQTKSFDEVTVMFADFVEFTKISEKLSPEALVQEIHTCFSAFDHIIQKHKVEKIKTIGDAYLCAGGLPVPDKEHAGRVVNAAIEMLEYVNKRKAYRESRGEIPFQLRIGINSGPVVAGIVGVKKYAYDIWGDTVNLAARMEQNSVPGKINISSRTYQLIKDKFHCTYRGKIQAKNKGETDMYFLEERIGEEQLAQA